MRRTLPAFLLSFEAFLLCLSGCSELHIMQPDSKQQAKQRWSSVRGKLKLEMARERFEAGQLEESQKLLDEALGLWPEAGQAYVLHARILLEKGETAAASDALDEAMHHGVDDAETDYLSGIISQRYEKLDDALAWYQRAAQRDLMNAAYVEAVAETLVALGRPTEALDMVRSRLTDFEQSATLRSLAGGIYMMLGRYEDAANAYRDAARISPDDQRVRAQLGIALTLSKNYAEAQATLSGLVKTEAYSGPTPPGGPEAPNAGARPAAAETSVLSALARSEMELNRAENAKTVLRKAVEADPKNARTWALLAQASAASKDLLTARRAAAQAAELADPSDRDEYAMLLGYICWAQHDYPAAISALRPLVDGKAQNTDEIALYLLADAYRSTGDRNEARAMVERALRQNPRCAWAAKWELSPVRGQRSGVSGQRSGS